MLSRKQIYIKKIVKELEKENFKSEMAMPRLEKVIVSVGIGKIADNQKFVQTVISNLKAITGQKPIIRKAHKAISGFKVRVGDHVGLMVTLRNERMYDFLNKLANITLPRLRDFRGINPKSFDNKGNLTIGIKEHLVFPEISHEAENIHGLEVSIVIKADTKKDAQKLIKVLGFPLKEEKDSATERSAYHG